MVAFNAAARVRWVQSQPLQIRRLQRCHKADYSCGFQHIKWGCFIKKAPRSCFCSTIRAPTDWIFFLFSTYKSCCACWNTQKNRVCFWIHIYTLLVPTLLQQGHADGQFLFTIFSAFYFPSIQLKIITFKKKNQTSVTRTCHRVKLTFYALFIKVSVRLCGILVADKDPFSKPSNIWELTIKRLKSAAATSGGGVKLKWKWQVRRNSCEKDAVEFVFRKGHSGISEVARSHGRNVYPALSVCAACCANGSTRL